MTTRERCLMLLERLDESALQTVAAFIEGLEEEADDVAFYDEAKAGDDGYRVQSNDLRVKYGL